MWVLSILWITCLHTATNCDQTIEDRRFATQVACEADKARLLRENYLPIVITRRGAPWRRLWLDGRRQIDMEPHCEMGEPNAPIS